MPPAGRVERVDDPGSRSGKAQTPGGPAQPSDPDDPPGGADQAERCPPGGPAGLPCCR